MPYGSGMQLPLGGYAPVTDAYRYDLRRIDEDKIRRDLAEIDTRSFPSPYPVPHSIPDTYAYDLQMQPLAVDFHDKNLLISNTKKKSKEDQQMMLNNMQQERDYYENILPGLVRKKEKLEKDYNDLKQYKSFQNSPEYQNLTQQLQSNDAEIQSQINDIEEFRKRLFETDPEAYQMLYPNGAPPVQAMLGPVPRMYMPPEPPRDFNRKPPTMQSVQNFGDNQSAYNLSYMPPPQSAP